MTDDTCRYPSCDAPTRDRDADGVSAYGAKFCSASHEVKYDHLKADAADARAAEQDADRGPPRTR